ncbi:hypothetical protein [Amycolatopsis taiwanensis]|uniref:Uncharacterized protein n=1 Tax=Amycolatopsis taiwanensis TaxID=342230 RepID=A0A9W6R0R6_9PSEU|nr:hypothetical protein [Amycolatopsis taiwanensis]GLY67203.1 hypothetical protein Atai01_38220 [Amycolatopsis taiwanensis]
MPASSSAGRAAVAIAPWLETPADWDAEFEADLEDLECLVETIVARAGYAR